MRGSVDSVPGNDTHGSGDDADPQAQALAAYQWNVGYLSECLAVATDLRDKAFFLGLNELAAMLEAVRAESDAVLMAMITARADAQAATMT